MHRPPDRREFLQVCAAPVLAGMAALDPGGLDLMAGRPARAEAPAPAKSKSFTLGFSLYGMNGLPLDEALRRTAEVGFTDVEPALMPGYSGDPSGLSKPRRAELRKLLESLGLGVPALMENLRPCVDDAAHAENLRRLSRAAELGHDLAPGRPVVVETVLGGKPSDWPGIRSQMVDRLGQWADAARQSDIILAVKPHVSNALHTPDDCRKLVDEINSPHLRAAFDYSHYEAQGLDLAESLETLIARTVFIHVKDTRRTAGKNEFLLPGEGRTDYTAYFRLLRKHAYVGSVTVEVSAMIHSKPGYDPIAAAKKSYAALKRAFDDSAAS